MFTTPPSLLERLRQSPEREAWEKFVEMYTPLLVGWTRRLALPDQEAADLIQDIFTVLVEKLPGFDYNPDKSFRAWLKTILRNRWRNLLRRRATLREQGEEGLAEAVAADDLRELEAAE